jgi:sulfate transport system permease protein
MGEFGAMPVVPGHVRGLSNTLPLHAEIRYYEDDFVAAFAVASLLAFLALLTLGAKAFVEWRSPELRGPAPRRAGRYTDRGAEP